MKPKVSSRDCCRGLKDCGCAVKTELWSSRKALSALVSIGMSVDGGVSPLPSPALMFCFCPLLWLVSAQCLVKANSCFSPEPCFPLCHQVPSQPPSKVHGEVVVVFQSHSEMVIHTFITARLDYGNSVLAGIPKRAQHKLQMVWNMADRIGVKKGQHHPLI